MYMYVFIYIYMYVCIHMYICKVPSSIPAENTSRQIHMDLST